MDATGFAIGIGAAATCAAGSHSQRPSDVGAPRFLAYMGLMMPAIIRSNNPNRYKPIWENEAGVNVNSLPRGVNPNKPLTRHYTSKADADRLDEPVLTLMLRKYAEGYRGPHETLIWQCGVADLRHHDRVKRKWRRRYGAGVPVTPAGR